MYILTLSLSTILTIFISDILIYDDVLDNADDHDDDDDYHDGHDGKAAQSISFCLSPCYQDRDAAPMVMMMMMMMMMILIVIFMDPSKHPVSLHLQINQTG